MLAKLAEALPTVPFLYEPKWDGFRAIVFRGGSELFIQSRDLRPLDRYFPELHEALIERLPDGCVLDGEIVVWKDERPAPFNLLQQRIGRKTLNKRVLADAPVAFIAYDLLEAGGVDLRELPQSLRRQAMSSSRSSVTHR